MTTTRKRVRRYPLPGEQAFVDYDPEAARDFGGGSAGLGGAERGCGSRVEGGIYACVPTSPNGRPVEHFLCCPPIRIDADEYGLSNIGVKLIDLPETCLYCGGGGKVIAHINPVPQDCPDCKGLGLVPVSHVFDIIGGEHYPNVADFIEEARRLGISRRLELGDAKEYARLSSRSRLFLLHARAIIENPQDYINAMLPIEAAALMEAGGCPKNNPQHSVNIGATERGLTVLTPYSADAPGCAALYWHDIEPGTAEEITEDCETCRGRGETSERHVYTESVLDIPVTCPDCEGGKAPVLSPRFSRRIMPSFEYGAFLRPEGKKPLHKLGVFGIFPLARLEVVDSSGGDEYSAAIERATLAKLPVKVTDK